VVVGRGLRISLPVSSHDMLKSPSTSLVRAVMMDGAITRLWTPKINSTTRQMLAMVKNGWFQRDWVKDTADVCGSVSQCHAPTAVHTDITARRILHLIVEGCRHAITSVRRLSKAFKSSHAVCSNDILSQFRVYYMCLKWHFRHRKRHLFQL